MDVDIGEADAEGRKAAASYLIGKKWGKHA